MIKLFQSKLIFSLLLLAALSNINGQSKTSDGNQLKLAKFFETQKNYKEAEKIYSELYKKNPQNFNFYSSYYNFLISQKKYDEAEELINKQLVLAQNKINITCDLGEIYYLRGNENKANEIWDSALKIDSENPFTYKLVAEYLIKHRNIDKAITVLQQGNDISKNPIIFSQDIAHLFSITMQFENAAKEYCEILKQNPNQIYIVRSRISTYLNSPNAKEITLQIIKDFCEEENKLEFYQLLKNLYFQTNEFNDAFETVKQIEKIRQNNGAEIFSFANEVSLLSKHKLAIEVYNYFIENYSDSPLISQAEINIINEKEKELKGKNNLEESWKPLVIKEKQNKDFVDLISSYKNISKKYANSIYEIEAKFRIAEIYLHQLNEIEKADSIITKLKIKNENSSRLNDIEFLSSQIAIKKNELKNAETILAELEKSTYILPEQKNKITFLLGKTKMWQGQFSEAIKSLNKLSTDSKDENVNDALQYSLILSTFKVDSNSLFLFINSDYLLEKNIFDEALKGFKEISENENLFILNDYASVKYSEILIALNKYDEAEIFLKKKINCDMDNIFCDRYLYLLGSNFFYGKNKKEEALLYLNRVIDEFPNSSYYNKVRTLISKINTERIKTL